MVRLPEPESRALLLTEYLDDNDGRLELTGNTESHEHYSHDLMTEHALEYIKENKDKPLFFYSAFTLPHFSSRSEDPHGFAAHSTEPYADKDWEPKYKKYAAMVHMLDRDVGRIVDLIDTLGLKRDTLIIFTSDNGGHHNVSPLFDTNGPLASHKRDLTEGGIRVPFIARWPGTVPMGETSNEIVTFWDMMPTFAELAGTDPPPGIDGISVVDALEDGHIDNPHEYLYWDYGHCRDRYDQAERMGKWKGIRKGSGNDIELYNLEEDPAEKHNIADKYPDIVEKIDHIMKKAVTPSDRYPVGKMYKGGPIWKKEHPR